MRRKKIKFSPKLQSSSLDDIKKFVRKDALNTPVISNYNTLPASYQNGGLPRFQKGGVQDPNEEVFYGGMLPEATVTDKLPITQLAIESKAARENPVRAGMVSQGTKGAMKNYDLIASAYGDMDMDNWDFYDKYGSNKNYFKNKIYGAPQYDAERHARTGSIDFSSTDIRAHDYVGAPNWAFAAPNMRGKQRADAERYHGDIIGGELLGLGVEKVASKAYSAGKKVAKNLGREGLYNSVNPVGYGATNKVVHAPKEFMRNILSSDTERAYRIGQGLRAWENQNIAGFGNTAVEKGIAQSFPSLKKATKWRNEILSKPVSKRTADDIEFVKEMDNALSVGKQRLDAWSLGLRGKQPFNSLQKIGDDTYRMGNKMHPSSFDLARKGEITKNHFSSLNDYRSPYVQTEADFKMQNSLRNLKSQKEIAKAAKQGNINQLDETNLKHVSDMLKTQRNWHPEKRTEIFKDKIRFHEQGDRRALRGLYTTDVYPSKGGMQKIVEEDIWDLHPFRNKKWMPKSLREMEMFEAAGGKPFKIKNTYEISPDDSYKITKSYKKGGLVPRYY